MLGEMRTIDHPEEIGIFLKFEMTAIEAGAEPGEATAMSSRCKWGGEIERRARPLRRRRKSLPRI
jgi:hypothetical protein